MNRWSCSIRLLRYLLCRSSQAAARSPAAFISLSGFWIGCVFIDRNDARSHGAGSMKRFREKTIRGLGIAGGAQKVCRKPSFRVWREPAWQPSAWTLPGR
jgi:hypothetical protein